MVPIPDVVEVLPAPKDRLLLPETKIMDPNFLVQDVSDAQVEAMLTLRPCFSFIFQALYESFFHKHWVFASRSSLVDRQRKQISFQIHISLDCIFLDSTLVISFFDFWFVFQGLVLAILNLINLVKVEERGKKNGQSGSQTHVPS